MRNYEQLRKSELAGDRFLFYNIGQLSYSEVAIYEYMNKFGELFDKQFLIILGACILVILILLYLWQSWQIIHLERKIAETRKRVVPIKERYKELWIEAIRAFSLSRIERIAKQRLGMVEPELKAGQDSS